MRPRRILVVEDGDEYVTSLGRIAEARGETVEMVRSDRLEAARAALAAGAVDGVFLDVVFDRVPVEGLAGDLDELASRLDGDRDRARRLLETTQGFRILDALADELARVPVVIAYDFSDEPGRLDALRERVPGLVGISDGASLDAAWQALVDGSQARPTSS